MKNTIRFPRAIEIAVPRTKAKFILAAVVAIVPLAAAPSARAQIIPASLTRAASPDSKIPNRVALLPPLRSEPRKPVCDAHQRLFITLSAGVYAASALDMQESESRLPHFREYDPLARPFVGLPAPAYYAAGALFATGVNWLGWKMARSPRWHKIWWVPQVATMAGNMAGYGYTRAHPSPR